MVLTSFVIIYMIFSPWVPKPLVYHNNLQACIQLCSKLGLPLHPDKLEGLSTCLSILGIELDSVTLQAWLPTDKRE